MIGFQKELATKIDTLIHRVYAITKCFPKEELYSSISQLRRAALSVILNFVEGFARRRLTVKLNFYEISYGSLKETRYLLYFSYKENWINHLEYLTDLKLTDEIGAMLWSEITAVEGLIKKEK